MPATFIKKPTPSTRVKQKPVKLKSRDPQSSFVPRLLPIQKHPPIHKHPPIQNRVHILLVHIPKLSIRGQARLAAEVKVSRSTISRLVSGRINPSYRLARGVTDALERMLGKPLDMREVFSTDGTYLTPSGCTLCSCRGCLPEKAWNEDGTLKPEWKGARPGDWSMTGLVHSGAAVEARSEERTSSELDSSDKQFHCDPLDLDPLAYAQLECDEPGSGDAEADFDARDAQFDARDAQFDAEGAQWEELR